MSENNSNGNELGKVLATPSVAASLDTKQLTDLLSVQAQQREQEKVDRDNEKILDAAVLAMEGELEDRIASATENYNEEYKKWNDLVAAQSKSEIAYIKGQDEAESKVFNALRSAIEERGGELVIESITTLQWADGISTTVRTCKVYAGSNRRNKYDETSISFTDDTEQRIPQPLVAQVEAVGQQSRKSTDAASEVEKLRTHLNGLALKRGKMKTVLDLEALKRDGKAEGVGVVQAALKKMMRL